MYISNWVLGSKDLSIVVAALSSKKICDLAREKWVKGEVKYPCSPLSEYSQGSGYRQGDPQVITGPVQLEKVLQKHLKVARVVVDYDGYRYVIDLPVYDDINGSNKASCYNPLVDRKPLAPPNEKTPTPVSTPTPVIETPTPVFTPTVVPTPTNIPGIIGMVVPVVKQYSEGRVVPWAAVTNSVGVTVIFYPDREENKQATSTPNPEATPTVHCDPTGTPPPTPPGTGLVTPVPTSPPVNPTVVHCPTEVTGIPTSTTDPGKPYTPPDGILVGTPGTATTTSTSSNTLSVPSDSVLVNKKGR